MSDKRRIDLSTYPRADVYKAFNDRMLPQFSTTCEVDVTALKTQLSSSAQTSPTFFVALSFAVSRAVNAVPALRHRVIDGELYEYSRVHPGYTVAREGDLFSFCDSLDHDDFATYAAHARQQMDAVRQDPDLSVGDKHQMFFITSVPWFRFTSFHHPYDPVYGYIPVITLGQCVSQADRWVMPVAIQVHHGTVDGIHVARFYQALQDWIERAPQWLA